MSATLNFIEAPPIDAAALRRKGDGRHLAATVGDVKVWAIVRDGIITEYTVGNEGALIETLLVHVENATARLHPEDNKIQPGCYFCVADNEGNLNCTPVPCPKGTPIEI